MSAKQRTDHRPLLEKALSAISGYDDHNRALDALAEHAKALAAAGQEDDLEALRDELRAAVLEGKPVPTDIGDRLTRAEDAARARAAELELIGRTYGRSGGAGLAGALALERDQLIRDSHGPAFDVLRAELDRIIETMAGLELGDADDLQTGVRDGRAEVWSTLLGLVDRYDAVRAAQVDLTVRALGGDGNRSQTVAMLEDVGFIRNHDQLDPAMIARRAPATKADPTAGDVRDAGPSVPLMPTRQGADWKIVADSPWPEPRQVRGSGPWPTDNRPAYLVWLCTGPAQLWLPTPRELADRHAEATRPTPATHGGDDRAERRVTKRLHRQRDQAAGEAAAEEERQRVRAARQ